MKSTLLIVSPQASFGVFVRDGLDSARFDAFFTSDFSDAIQYVRQIDCPTVLLDAELDDVELSVLDIGFALRQLKPDIQFILIIRAGQEVDTASLSPVATIVKPVVIPDLTLLLERLDRSVLETQPLDSTMPEFKNPERPIDEPTRLMWATDVSKAAQQLTQLTLESSAQAAFITRQNELWAYAGQLSREAAQELTDSIQRYWNAEGESDLLRFVRLQATEAQHMLYVRKLSGSMTLALVFDAETPFSTIRSQAGKLVKNLFENTNSEPAKSAPVANSQPSLAQLESTQDDSGDYPDIPPISELLGEIPPPIPPRSGLNMNLPWEQPSQNLASQDTMVSEPEHQQEQPAQTKSPISIQEGSPASRRPVPAMDETFANQPFPLEVDRHDKSPRDEIAQDLQVTRRQETYHDPESLIATRAQPTGSSPVEGAHKILLEPPFVTHVNLTYTCVLVPRFEHHHLVGDAATRLNEWMPQLCVAFGWRLEYISVRPDYFQWIVRVPLHTAAGNVINIIRKHTSERYFNEFPRFKADNPSGEFWAHGFIVQGGAQPTEQKVIRDFIKTTRTRQGLR